LALANGPESGTRLGTARPSGFRGPVYSVANPTAYSLSSFPISLTNNNYYGGSYTTGPLINYSNVLGLISSNPSAFTVDNQPLNALQSNYDLVERVGAGYVMNSINFNRFRQYTGLRFETTSEYAAGYQVTLDDSALGYSGVSPLHKSSTIVDALPSVELRYALTGESAIRLAYGRGIARANFGDLAPSLTVDDTRPPLPDLIHRSKRLTREQRPRSPMLTHVQLLHSV
jgi:hypothetical protein